MRVLRTVAMLALGTVASLIFAAAASAQSCRAPAPSGLWTGTENSPASTGYWESIVTVSPEETSPGSNTLALSGSAEVNGSAFALPFSLNGPLRGTITCEGEANFEIDWSGLLHGEVVSGFVTTYSGHAHDTTQSGSYSSPVGGGEYTGAIAAAQQSAGPQPGLVAVVNPSGTLTSSVSAAPVDPSQLPPGLVAPVGAVTFTVSELAAFGTIDVTLVLPSGSEPTEAYKSVGGQYEPYPAAKTKFHGNEITVELTDNELPWDEDLELGVITDPIIPVHAQVPTGPAPAHQEGLAQEGLNIPPNACDH